MLDLVPLTRPRRQVRNAQRESGLICQALELPLPEPAVCTVRAAAIGDDQEFMRVRIADVPLVLPPPADAFDGAHANTFQVGASPVTFP